MSDLIKLLVTDTTTGTARFFPLDYVDSFSCKIARYGGYAEFSLSTSLPWGTSLVDWVSNQDRLELYYQGVLRYRGYVRGRTRSEEEPKTLIVEGYGALLGIRNQICRKRIGVTIDAADISSIFSQVINSFVLTARGPNGLPLIQDVEVQSIGVTSSGVDGYNKLSGDVLDDIQNQTANLAVWGCDVNPANQDRAYTRKINTGPTPDHVIVLPSPNVEAAQSEDQEADIRNILLINGGNPIFPQLCHNGDFQLPAYHQDASTNLLQNGGFEIGSVNKSGDVADWGNNGTGASIKNASYSPPSIIQPYEGNNCLQLDKPGRERQPGAGK